MLDSHIIMLYTDGLYRCPEENLPTYTEFRDMFSRGQLLSKFWLVEELYKAHRLYDERIVHAGSWFGLLGYLLRTKFIDVQVTCLDIDPRCEQFLAKLTPEYQANRVTGVTGDLYNYDYTEDVIINTSCEHLTNLSQWLKRIPSGKTVVLQSSNYKKLKEHVNCVYSVQQFKDQVQAEFSQILFEGQLNLAMYTRYMIIGKKS
jgi:hypothetical protein